MDNYTFLIYVMAYIGLFATSFYVINLFTYYKTRKPIKEATDKTVSIIIPAYNEQKSIKKTIESALALDYPEKMLEIIVVDDGSKDNTYRLAKEYESNSRIRVFTKQNGGKGSALNLGIRKAKGEIIITMDADTIVRPDALKKMIGHFYSDEVVSVAPSMGIYKPEGILRRIQQIEYYMGVFLRKSFATVNAVHITPGAFSAYRKSFFEKYGGYDEHNLTEDLEIALRIQSHHYIIENSEGSAVYTLGPDSFRKLMVQRRRWYTGLMKNLWAYRRMFSPKYGALGILVLPVAVTTVLLSIILTSYLLIRTILHLKTEIVNLNAVNFRFDGFFEVSRYSLNKFFFTIFSNPMFLIAFLFITMLAIYLKFSRSRMLYKESIRLSFILFITMYSFLFSFWWIVSIAYVLFNRKVVWREEPNGPRKKK